MGEEDELKPHYYEEEIKTLKMHAELWAASDGNNYAMGVTEEDAVNGVKQVIEATRQEAPVVERGAPIEPQKGLGWFEGTSWGK